jgi:penicillin-binding protein 1A
MTKKQTNKRSKRIFKRLFQLFIIILIAVTGFVGYTVSQAPTITENQLRALPNETGKQDYIKVDKIPKTYQQAVMATEDATFPTNNGLNRSGIKALITSNIAALFGQGTPRGGSSITQQLVKLTVFSTDASDQTITRKIQEIYLALKITREYSKPQLFEYYVNKLYEGHNSYGAQTIANLYYDKPLSELTLAQQATISGIGQSPANFDLYTNPDLVKERRDIVLLSMLNNGNISKSMYNDSKASSITDGLINR